MENKILELVVNLILIMTIIINTIIFIKVLSPIFKEIKSLNDDTWYSLSPTTTTIS